MSESFLLSSLSARVAALEADRFTAPNSPPTISTARPAPVVLGDYQFPRGPAVVWAYDPADIPAGWEEATEMRGMYVAGYDPGDPDYDEIGYGLNTNTFTGYKLHGVTENNHAPHWHTIASVGGTITVTTANISYIHSAGAGASSATIITAVDPSTITVNPTECPTGGMTWCDAENDTDNRPPTFVAIWIRRPLLP